MSFIPGDVDIGPDSKNPSFVCIAVGPFPLIILYGPLQHPNSDLLL